MQQTEKNPLDDYQKDRFHVVVLPHRRLSHASCETTLARHRRVVVCVESLCKTTLLVHRRLFVWKATLHVVVETTLPRPGVLVFFWQATLHPRRLSIVVWQVNHVVALGATLPQPGLAVVEYEATLPPHRRQKYIVGETMKTPRPPVVA